MDRWKKGLRKSFEKKDKPDNIMKLSLEEFKDRYIKSIEPMPKNIDKIKSLIKTTQRYIWGITQGKSSYLDMREFTIQQDFEKFKITIKKLPEIKK
jgi:hypothetical protein